MMANKTTNYNLTKPHPEEFYDINVHNTNMDIIDEELKKRVVVSENGKISPEQLPSMDYVPNSEKGKAGGVATLGNDNKIPAEQLPEFSSSKSTNVVLDSNGWNVSADGRFYQTLVVSGVTSDTKVVLVDVDLSTDDVDAKSVYLEAWLLVAANEVKQGNGTLTFYSWDKPTVNIPVNVGVI